MSKIYMKDPRYKTEDDELSHNASPLPLVMMPARTVGVAVI